MLPHTGVLESIQSVSAVIVYRKLFLVLSEIRPSLCPSTADTNLCTREHLLRPCKSKGCEEEFPSSLFYTKTDWGTNRSKGLSKVSQEGCCKRESWPPANLRHCSYSHTGESCTTGHILKHLSFKLKCTTLKKPDRYQSHHWSWKQKLLPVWTGM